MEWPGKEELRSTALREWYVDDEAAGKTRSSGNFTFATIYKAGHFVSHASSGLNCCLIHAAGSARQTHGVARHDKPVDSRKGALRMALLWNVIEGFRRLLYMSTAI